MSEILRDIIARNRAGQPVAIPSVCSSQPDVLRASIGLAHRLGRPIVIEATSNQVNQDGGYMGMRPAAFISYVQGITDAVGADREAVLFGGDHLGTQVWRASPPEAAMEKARVLVRDYVQAGFGKIHLDCSEGCQGEPAELDDEITAARSADLARICADSKNDLLFVVGTEVPPPGGARADEDADIPATQPQAARQTLAAHDDAFGDLAPHIGGLVVLPGVEFSPTEVHHLPLHRDPGLIEALSDRAGVCLEAHSTDYQLPEVYPRLASLGFAFQKVGPALTFAARRVLYALDQLRRTPGMLQSAMETAMQQKPAHWQQHYHGDADAIYDQLHFGLADRIRYYWPTPLAQKAVAALREELAGSIPDTALQRVFAADVLDRAETLNGAQFQRLIDAQIELSLAPYFFEDSA